MIWNVSKYAFITTNQYYSPLGPLISHPAVRGVCACVQVSHTYLKFSLSHFNLYWGLSGGRKAKRGGDQHHCRPVPGADSGTLALDCCQAKPGLPIGLHWSLRCPSALFSLWENAEWDYRLTLESHKTQAMAPSIQQRGSKDISNTRYGKPSEWALCRQLIFTGCLHSCRWKKQRWGKSNKGMISRYLRR